MHGRDLGRVTGATGTGACHQPRTGVTRKSLRGMYSLGQDREHLYSGRVDAGLLRRLAERRGSRTAVGRVDGAAGERGLARMVAQVGSAAGSAAGRDRPAPSPNRIRTADGRGGRRSAWRVRMPVAAPVNWPAGQARRGRGQAGGLARGGAFPS